MENNSKKLNKISIYIAKSIKFYELKNEFITPVVFSILLFVNLIGALISNTSNFNYFFYIPFFIILAIFTKLLLSFYIIVYIKELKSEPYTVKECIKLILGRAIKILVTSFIFAIPTVLIIIAFLNPYLYILVIPGIFLYLTFLFYTCFIVDENTGIKNAFVKSKKATDKNKKGILFIMLALYLILMIAFMFLESTSLYSDNMLLFMFIFYFIVTIISLINERLIALLYIDLYYGKKSKTDIANT